MRGLDRTKEGLALLLKIASCINSKRYFKDVSLLPTNDEINSVLSMESVYDTSDDKTFKDKVNEYLYEKKYNKAIAFKVYVYDANKNYLCTYPSMNLMAKELNLKPHTISKYKDSDKPYKGYYIYSELQESK